jgi:hypothetical protein
MFLYFFFIFSFPFSFLSFLFPLPFICFHLFCFFSLLPFPLFSPPSSKGVPQNPVLEKKQNICFYLSAPVFFPFFICPSFLLFSFLFLHLLHLPLSFPSSFLPSPPLFSLFPSLLLLFSFFHHVFSFCLCVYFYSNSEI